MKKSILAALTVFFMLICENHAQNVGIGIDAPAAPLHVSSTDEAIGVQFDNTLTGGFAGTGRGILNSLNGASNATIYGMVNSIANSGSGDHTGVYNLFNSGTGNWRGMYNLMAGAAAGALTGVDNSITSSGNGTHTGIYSVLSGSGTGVHQGVYNSLEGTGTGNRYGVRSEISGTPSSGSSIHAAFSSSISSGGSGPKYGGFHTIGGSGTGSVTGQYVTVTSTTNSFQYGFYSNINNSGSGSKYGLFTQINDATAGTHYGVYSNVLKSGSYAGYYLGTLAVGTAVGNIYRFPASRGTANQIMQTDGSGNVTWVDPSALGAGDVDWLEEGLNTAPDADTDEIYHSGNVGIGKVTTDYQLDVLEDAAGATRAVNIEYTGGGGTPTAVNIFGNGSGAGNQTVLNIEGGGTHDNRLFGAVVDITNTSATAQHYGLQVNVNNGLGGQKRGITTNVAGSGNSAGISNSVSGTGFGWGILNNVSLTGGIIYGLNTTMTTAANSSKYGHYSLLSGGNGNHYGHYSRLEGTGTALRYGFLSNIQGTPASGVAAHFGFYSYILSAGTGGRYGLYNDIDSDGSGPQVGVFNWLSGEGFGDQTGTYNRLSGIMQLTKYGVQNDIYSSSAVDVYGMHNAFNISTNLTGAEYGVYTSSSSNTGNKYGMYTEFLSGGSFNFYGAYNTESAAGANVFGTYNYFPTANNGVKAGTYNIFSSNDNVTYGSYTSIDGTGTGERFGSVNTLSGTSTNTLEHYGTFNRLMTTGPMDKYGTYNSLEGATSGQSFATFNLLAGNAADDQYAVYNQISDIGSANKYGIYNESSIDNAAYTFGMYNEITQDGNGFHFGVYNDLTGTGSGDKRGVYNVMNGTGTVLVGDYTDIQGTGTGWHYANYARLQSTGNGSKFGYYVLINPTAGGAHYGVYSQVLNAGANSWAGYFLGDVYIGTDGLNGYNLPPIDGGSGQVIQTDGAGQASWVNASTLGYWTRNAGDLYPSTITDDVGIGTNAPSVRLHVEDDDNTNGQVIIEPASSNGQDAMLTIRGARNGSTTVHQAQLRFENFDDNLPGTNILGSISGWVTNGTTNIGDLAFFNSADGSSLTETMRLKSDGDVGIGTTTPVDRLEVAGGRVEFTGGVDASGTAGTGVLEIQNSLRIDDNEIITNNGTTLFLQQDNVGDLQVDAGTLHVDASLDRVGINTGTPVADLHVNGGRVEFTGATDASGTAGTGVLEIANALRIDGNEIITNTGTPLSLQADNAGDLRVDGTTFCVDASTNWVGLGFITPSFQLHLSQNFAAKPTSNVWTVSSDARLKKDVHPYTDGLDLIRKINPVWFTYNGKAGMPDDTGVGTIAQEFRKIAPYMVLDWVYTDPQTGEEKTYLAIDYGPMQFALVNAIREQQEMIEENAKMREENHLLRQELEDLKSRMDQLEVLLN